LASWCVGLSVAFAYDRLVLDKTQSGLDMNLQKTSVYLCGIFLVLGIGGCKQKPVEKKSYFKRDEFKQGSSFRLPQHMSYEELKEQKERLVKNHDEAVAITYLGFMIKKCADPLELERLRLELADMLYQVKRCAEATVEYQLYAQLYPGSDRAAYADFQAIKALNCEVLSADRDQDRTQEVIDLAKKFAQKATNRLDYAQYLSEVEKITQTCARCLCNAEILRFYFNINHGQFKAARARLDWIKGHFNVCITEPELLELEYRFDLASGDRKTVG
jgi:outer membrane protein assembly factor BamD (BamD/ComL family)